VQNFKKQDKVYLELMSFGQSTETTNETNHKHHKNNSFNGHPPIDLDSQPKLLIKTVSMHLETIFLVDLPKL
jgi:hypothetical protein